MHYISLQLQSHLIGRILLSVAAIVVFLGAAYWLLGPEQQKISAAGPGDYLETVNLPACDSSNSEVKFIRRASDWSDINNSSYTIFCVEPGNYVAAGVITVRRGGTVNAPLYIRYYNPSNLQSDTHPVDMPRNDRAILYSMKLEQTSNIVIDGLAFEGKDINSLAGIDRLLFLNGTSGSIINRVLIERGGSGSGQLSINSNSNNNVVQNSVIRDSIMVSNKDIHGIRIDSGSTNNRVVHNEIYNIGGDAVQLGENRQEGNVIAYNDMYVTSERYTDCNGNLDPNGNCACAENALDFKGYGTANNPVIIEGNRIWGWREIDWRCSSSGGNAAAINFANRGGDKEYILVKDNLVWDVPRAVSMNGGEGADHISFINNLFYKIHNPIQRHQHNVAKFVGHEPGTIRAMDLRWKPQDGNINSIELYYNTFVDVAPGGEWINGSNIPQSDLMCNVVIDGKGSTPLGSNSTANYNAYYDTDPIFGSGGNNHLGGGAAAAQNDRYCFVHKVHTEGSAYCIPHAVTTTNSPHADLCQDVSVGSRSNIGIDNAVYTQTAAGFRGLAQGSVPDTTDPAGSTPAPMPTPGDDIHELATITTLTSATGFDALHPPIQMFDGCTEGNQVCTGGSLGEQMVMEFDFGEIHDIESVHLFGDADGDWHSARMSLFFKSDAGGTYIQHFVGRDVLGNRWFDFHDGFTARYVRVVIHGTAGNGSVQARELRIVGTPRGLSDGSGSDALGDMPATSPDQQPSTPSTPEVPDTPTQPNTDRVCAYTWTRSLGVGDSGEDVLKLQRFLNDRGFTVAASGNGSYENESDYYGTLTAGAVSEFQLAYIEDVLRPLDLQSGTGYFGNLTRQKANALCGGSGIPDVPDAPEAPDDTPTQPDSPTTPDTDKSDSSADYLITPTADTYAHHGFRTRNYGRENILEVRFDGTTRESYLRFDISDISADVERATLKLYVADQGNNARENSIFLVANDSWGEYDLTWNNQPGSPNWITRWNVPTNGSVVEIDVTEQVRSEVAGDGTISFKLTSLDQYVRYGSRESDNPPVLVVETNTAARSDSLQQSFATLMRNLAAVSESIIQYLRAAVESVW